MKMVVDLSALWCGPYKLMEPTIHKMVAKFIDVEFLKINVDELSDMAEEFGVEVMPTFVLVKQEKEVDRVVGLRRMSWRRRLRNTLFFVRAKKVEKFEKKVRQGCSCQSTGRSSPRTSYILLKIVGVTDIK